MLYIPRERYLDGLPSFHLRTPAMMPNVKTGMKRPYAADEDGEVSTASKVSRAARNDTAAGTLHALEKSPPRPTRSIFLCPYEFTWEALISRLPI